MKEVETFVKGVSEANKTALDTAKAAWEKETLKILRIRVVVMAVEEKKKKVVLQNMQLNVQNN